MTQEWRLLQHIGEVDEQYIRFAQADCPRTAVRAVKVKWIVLAACLALLLVGCVGAASVYLPEKEPPVSKELEEFVTYNFKYWERLEFDGRIYSFYQHAPTRVLTVGECIGRGVYTYPTVEYEEKLWMEIENTDAAVYAVKGIDPFFMVATAYGEVYICDNNIQLKTGADIFEKRLRLKERYVKLEHNGWVDTEQRRLAVDPDWHDEFEAFLDALCDGICVAEDAVDLDNQKTVFVTLDNGLEVRIGLYDGGYVRFSHFDVAVKMDETIFDEFRAMLTSVQGSPWKTVTYPDWDAIKAEMDKKKSQP